MTWIDKREEQDGETLRASLAKYRELKAAGRSRVAEYDNGDDRFGLWLALVDARISRAYGIGLFDLADWNMYDAYESGSSPAEGAREALESDDTYSALVGGE